MPGVSFSKEKTESYVLITFDETSDNLTEEFLGGEFRKFLQQVAVEAAHPLVIISFKNVGVAHYTLNTHLVSLEARLNGMGSSVETVIACVEYGHSIDQVLKMYHGNCLRHYASLELAVRALNSMT